MKKYKFFNKEKEIYKYWKENNFFKPNLKSKKKTFSIIMPPPNITGNLHIGHAFQQTIMDIIVRYKKMSNRNTLWIMGTDHAGIATQIVVEKNINIKKNKLKKKEIIKEIWKWKNKYEKKINKQTELIGSSVDWSKTYFSLDKDFSFAVKKTFIKLYKKKLIYKKKKIIYCDIKLKTILSDLEINIKKKKVKNYFIKFKIFKEKHNIIISTTKPEKLISITGIITNNNNLKNKFVINPITNKLIKIIFSKNIKNKYLLINPNYNNNDFILSKKYNLNIIEIFKSSGIIRKKIIVYNYKLKKIKYLKFKNLKWIKNLNYLIVRKKIINFLKKNNYIQNIKYKNILIKYSNKTNSIVLPIITNQWFIKIKKLSKKAIEVIKYNKINIYPKKYKNLFFSWMNNIQDWCISRQIYWGHKIPIWYDKEKKKYVGYNIKYIYKKNPKLKNKKLKQEKSVLDTWFSSSIWTLACLGWPKKNNKKINLFHPISLVISGFDIIFFWISRMIMMTLYLKKEIPFKKIFITGLIRDENGKKMSKSLGNVINLNDLIYGISLKKLIKQRTKNLIKENNINKIIKNTKKNFPNGIKPHNTDTVRFTLTSITTSNLKINFNKSKLIYSYNYCNKLWNVCKYILCLIKNKNIKYKKKYINFRKLNLIEIWIINKINILIKKYHKNIKIFKFDVICNLLYQFLKNDFCDWYIESTKITNLNINNIYILIYVIKKQLLLSHPIIPFITEYIWKKIDNKNKSILNYKIPKIKKLIKKYNYIKIFEIYKKIIFILRKFNKKNINIKKILILNININIKKIIFKNKYLLKIIKINNLFIFKKINFDIIIKKYKLNYIKPILIYKNIYITFKSE